MIHKSAFGTTGVQEITAAAGVPKGSFYSYFESKDDYAIDLIESYWISIDEAQGPTLRDPSRAPLDAIRGFFAGLIAYHAEKEYVPGCLIGNLALELATTNPKMRSKLQQIFAHWTAGLAARLREAREDGAIDADVVPEEIAATLIDAFEGAVLRAKVDRTHAALRRFEHLLMPRLLQ